MKEFAVLVLNYNGKKYLQKCISSLLQQTSQSFDIYLVDNNSHDGSREFVKKTFPKVHIINTGANLAFSGGYNFAVRTIEKKKKYTYYLFLNNDAVADKDLISTMQKTFAISKKIAIVNPSVIDESKKLACMGGTFLFPTGSTLGYKNGEFYKRGNTIYKCFWASGSALAIRANLFKKSGYFSDYFIYYEDVDLSWRMNNAGYDVVATDATYIKHVGGGAKTPIPLQLFLCERNRLICYWQNLPNMLFIFIFPIFLFLRLILVAYNTRSLKGVWAKIKGNILGIILIAKYKKNVYSLKNHVRSILLMNTVTVYAKL